MNQRQMRLWHLLLQQVSKSYNPENPENPENPGSDNSVRTKHPVNARYACGICTDIVGGKLVRPI